MAPSVSLYANLPQEWPLARLSVQLRHIGVLLRVTLYRRRAELSFREVALCQLPREVMRDISRDFDSVCREIIGWRRCLHSLPTSANTGQSLYADPGFWLYGLLSFCAKAKQRRQMVLRPFELKKNGRRRSSRMARLCRSCRQWSCPLAAIKT